jgi:hypothetical protein
MRTRFIIGVIACLGSFSLAFEATGIESQRPNFGTSSSSDEISIRLNRGQDVRVVRVGRKLAALIAEGGAASLRGHYAKAISLFSCCSAGESSQGCCFRDLFFPFIRLLRKRRAS